MRTARNASMRTPIWLSLIVAAALFAGCRKESGDRSTAAFTPDFYEATPKSSVRLGPPPGTKGSGECEAGLQAFRGTVHNFVQTSCTRCHGGAGPGPGFAVPNAEESYRQILRYVNFNDVGASRFVEIGGNYHCFNAYGFDCGVQTPEPVRAAVESWWRGGQEGCPEAGNFFSADVAIPANLPPRGENYVMLRFDLSSLGEEFYGVFLELEAQKFADATPDYRGAYRFRRPRLATPEHTIALRGLRVLVNGHWDTLADRYVMIDTVVSPHAMPTNPAQALPFPVLSSDPLIVPIEKTGLDRISVSFDAIALAPERQCRSLETFTRRVLPVLEARSCFHCHGGGTQNSGGVGTAVQRMSLAGTHAEICKTALERIDFMTPRSSPWISFPLRGVFNHPRLITSPAEIFPAWTDWIQAERARGTGPSRVIRR